MILPLQQAVRAALQDTLTTLYGQAAVPATLVIETPPTRALGDLALPCAFELARTLRKAPRAIATEIVAALPAIPGVARIEAVGGGYINVFLDRAAFLRSHLGHASTSRQHRPRQDHRRAHGDQPEQGRPHRPPPQLRPRRHGRAPAALPRHARSRSRTTSTTPACRSPTSSSGSSDLEGKGLRRGARAGRRREVRLRLLGPVREGHRVVRRRQGPAGHPQGRRCTPSSTATTPPPRWAPFIADAHRPLPPAHDGPAATSTTTCSRGKATSCACSSGRRPSSILKRAGRGLPADGGQTEGLLGDEDRRRRRRRRSSRARPRHTGGRGRGRRRPNQREKVIVRSERHRHLRRQGHRQPVLEVRPARQGLPLPSVRDAARPADPVGDDLDRRRARRHPDVRARRHGLST